MSEANNFTISVFSEVLTLFEKIYTEFDAWSLLLGAFTLFAIYRLLLVPLLGSVISSGQSDFVKGVRKDRSVKGVTGLEKKGKG